jgi:hypothetical protein
MNDKKKKFLLIGFEFFITGIFLSAITFVLIYISNLFSILQPKLNIYYFGIISGATGGIWGYVLTVVYDFQKEIKTNQSFVYHPWKRIVIFIGSILAIIIVTLIINTKIN